MIRKILHAYLPEYANGTLPLYKRWLIEFWLKFDASARLDLEVLLHLRMAVISQPLPSPSLESWRKVQAKIRTSKVPNSHVPSQSVFWRAWAAGMALVLLSLVLLWQVFPPGITLQWTSISGEPLTFRIYRASSSSSHQFELLDEISPSVKLTSLEARVYTYSDYFLLPGQEYIYRIEAVDQNGVIASQQIISDAAHALPGQISLFVTLLILAYGLSVRVFKTKHLSFRVISLQ